MNFIASNYAVMRHAKVESTDLSSLVRMEETTIIDSSSLTVLEHNCHLLVEKICDNYKKVLILHSPKKRAGLTAEQVACVLQEEDLLVEIVESQEWLDESCWTIDNDVLTQVLTKNEDTFVILISHMPTLEQYTGRTPMNCSIMAKDFMVGRWKFRD